MQTATPTFGGVRRWVCGWGCVETITEVESIPCGNTPQSVPQELWGEASSPRCQLICWSCHQDKHSGGSSAQLQITVISRQQLALVQLVGREWLISISPRGEGRKGTFPFSWAKNLALGAVWWVYCVRQISRGLGAAVSPWQHHLFAHWIPVAAFSWHILFLLARGCWSFWPRVKNNCVWGKPASRFPVLLARGVQREENGEKRRGCRSWAWSSSKSEVFSDDRRSQDGNLLLPGPICRIYTTPSCRDLYSRSAAAPAEVLARGCCTQSEDALPPLLSLCVKTAPDFRGGGILGERLRDAHILLQQVWIKQMSPSLTLWLPEKVLPSISSPHKRRLQWQNLCEIPEGQGQRTISILLFLKAELLTHMNSLGDHFDCCEWQENETPSLGFAAASDGHKAH